MAIILGLPKGSLQESTFALFRKAGFDATCSSRSYIPSINDEEIKCRLLRPQEMSRYVELGLLDAGICGYDWVYENGSDVEEICELNYSKATSNPVRWVLAVPNDSKIKSVKDLNGKRISTEAVGLVKRYLKKHKVKGADIEAIEQALDEHEWQKSKSLTKDEAKAEWESFLSDINDEEVEITDGGYVTVRFHELVPMTIDEIIHWVEGDSVGEKTWK